MRSRQLGAGGLTTSALGLGAMGFSSVYGQSDDDESIATIRRALELGITLVDTADVYGGGHNERLVGRAIAGRRRDDIVLSTKFGLTFEGGAMGVDGSPAYVRRSIEGSLQRLGVDWVDLYILHRIDPDTPIEETVGALGELVREGKIRHVGLSEPSAETVRRGHAVHPIAVVESEYSLWSRQPEQDVLPATRELGIGFVAYSPLGRGWLTGAVRSRDELPEGDFRRSLPQFQPGNFERNLALADEVRALAVEKGVEPAQLALAWLLAQGPQVVPIFGTRRRQNVEANAAAAEIELTAEELARLDALAPPVGERWPAEFMEQLGR
jgi:aryl-alcohol dehydrogenase-like predicted oxidoreductase